MRSSLCRSGPGKARPAEPQHPLDVRLGDRVRLVGYDLSEEPVPAGGQFDLVALLAGQCLLTDRYKVFTHLIGTCGTRSQGNFLWGQQDNEPQAGPTADHPLGAGRR